MDMPALQMQGVDYTVRSRRNRTTRSILSSVSLTLPRGESAAIMGPSGAGKSTILSLCLGLLQPSSGTISVVGQDIARLSKRAKARLRGLQMGMVFQAGELLPELSPLDNVALPALLSPRRQSAYDAARAALRAVGLGASIEEVPTPALSGGERQRVAVARALVNEPELILADEPTGSLDSTSRDAVASHLFGLTEMWGCALLVVTHDHDVAARADRIYDLKDGKLEAMG